MDKTFSFEVLAEPKGQPRPKFCRRGAFVHTYNPPSADAWKKAVKISATVAGLKEKRLAGPIGLELVFRIPRPLSHFGSGKNANTLKPASPVGWHTQKPDLDNVEKVLKDALSDVGAWEDDCQVCSCVKSKVWVDGKEEPVSSVTIKML